METFNSENFAGRINELLEEWHVPGLAIGIVQDDQTSCHGFGRASVHPEKPVTASTIFDIASCSKSLTAAAIALLVEDDERYPRVKWDAKMSDLLPQDFVMAQERYTDEVTVEDILSHRSGLPSHDLSYMHGDTPRSVTRNLRNLPITKPIRTTEQYCNMMYTVASHLIEELSGQSLADFLRAELWQPLGMTSTFLQHDAVVEAGLKDRLFTPHRWDDHEKRYYAARIQQIREAQGAGSVFTCASDYILWIKAILHQSGPVTEGVYRGITKPRTISCPEDCAKDDLDPYVSPTMYAAGFEIQYYRGHKIVMHLGGDPGIGALIFFLPAWKFGGVMFGNSWRAGDVALVLARELFDVVLKVPTEERPQWNSRMHQIDDEYHDGKDDQMRRTLGMSTEGEMPALESQDCSLDLYTGSYSNRGYHEVVVQIKDGALYIDMTDRTMGFYLHLEHYKDQDKYVAHAEDYYDGAKSKLAVKFVFEEGKERAVRIGIDLEEAVGDYIWFDRVNVLPQR